MLPYVPLAFEYRVAINHMSHSAMNASMKCGGSACRAPSSHRDPGAAEVLAGIDHLPGRLIAAKYRAQGTESFCYGDVPVWACGHGTGLMLTPISPLPLPHAQLPARMLPAEME